MPADVLVVVIDSTGGWIAAAHELTAALRRAGARAELVHGGPVPRVRTFALTDFTQARLARRAALRGIEDHDPAAIVYCSISAALLWPRPGAIYLDSVAAENRPGRHGYWQRPVERRRLRQATLLLPWSERTLEPIPEAERARAVVLPPSIELPPPAGPERDIDVLTYAGDPVKRRLDLVLGEWERARRPGETLVVAGHDGFTPASDGVRSVGRVPGSEFRELLLRSRVFLAAPRREDHGIAALEALACGCRLVTTPSPGPYPARDLARELDPRLVTEDLGTAIRLALDDPPSGYAQRARELLAPHAREAVDRTLAGVVLPLLI